MKIVDLLKSLDKQACLLGIYYLQQTDFLKFLAYNNSVSQLQKYNISQILSDPSIIHFQISSLNSKLRSINSMLLVIRNCKSDWGVFMQTIIELYIEYENQ